MISRIRYYLFSIPTLLGQIINWYEIPRLLFSKRPLTIRLRNGRFYKVRNLMDVWVVKESCLDRDYETNGTPLQNNWTIIDIGAGIGEFSVLAAKDHPNVQVYAYEPFPESFQLLQDNIQLNNVENIKAFQTAVGSKTGQMVLAKTGEAVQHTTTGSTLSGKATSYVEVQGQTLDNVLRSNGIDHCDFLKIDCEGCEFEILLNASLETLEKFSHISLEYHNGFTQHTHLDLVKHLEKNGFHIKLTPNPVHDYLGFLYAHR